MENWKNDVIFFETISLKEIKFIKPCNLPLFQLSNKKKNKKCRKFSKSIG